MFSVGIVWLLFGIGNAISSTCPDWVAFNGSSYCFNDNRQSWSNATKTCEDFGGGLAVPNIEEEEHFIFWDVFKKHKKLDIRGIWIDCSLINGEWVCSDSTPCERSTDSGWGWNPTQPYNESCPSIVGYFDFLKKEKINSCRVSSCGGLKFSVCESATETAYNNHQSPATVCLQADTNSRFTCPCLTGHVIKEVPIKGVVACGSACREEPQCRSFNVRLSSIKEQICQFRNVTREDADKEDMEMNNSCYYFDV